MDVKSGNAVLSGAERLEARRKSEEKTAMVKAQNRKALDDHAKAQQVEAAKTARLRALRLAKEAADLAAQARDAAAPAPAAARPAPTRRRARPSGDA